VKKGEARRCGRERKQEKKAVKLNKRRRATMENFLLKKPLTETFLFHEKREQGKARKTVFSERENFGEFPHTHTYTEELSKQVSLSVFVFANGTKMNIKLNGKSFSASILEIVIDNEDDIQDEEEEEEEGRRNIGGLEIRFAPIKQFSSHQ